MISFNSSAGGRAQPIRFMVAINNLPVVLPVLQAKILTVFFPSNNGRSLGYFVIVHVELLSFNKVTLTRNYTKWQNNSPSTQSLDAL
jgi:hypothetical protein